MKLVVRILIGAVALVVAAFLVQGLAAESGEVVLVTITDDAGATSETRLWVVDHDGSTWLRAGNEATGWYQRLVKRPEIEVKRNDTGASYVARPEPEQRDAINRLMNEKYGWADTYIGWMFARSASVPIRLVPR